MSDGPAASEQGGTLLLESMEDLYEHAPCGYVSTLDDGRIVTINQTLLGWTGYERDELVAGVRLPDLFTIGGRLFHHTHVAPMLATAGFVREIAAEIVCAGGTTLPVLFNAARRVVFTATGSVPVIRYTLLDATERRAYERELLEARERAEQALATVRQLEELLPICAWCHRVRSDDGNWMQLDRYLAEQGTEVSHGICRDCAADPDAHA